MAALSSLYSTQMIALFANLPRQAAVRPTPTFSKTETDHDTGFTILHSQPRFGYPSAYGDRGLE